VRVGPQNLYTLVLALDTVVASGYRLRHHDCGVGSSLELMRRKGGSKSTLYLYVCLMCAVQAHILDDAHVGDEDGLRMLVTRW
jgi:hypothetical protein